MASESSYVSVARMGRLDGWGVKSTQEVWLRAVWLESVGLEGAWMGCDRKQELNYKQCNTRRGTGLKWRQIT